MAVPLFAILVDFVVFEIKLIQHLYFYSNFYYFTIMSPIFISINISFHHKLEFIQYNACLAKTGAIRSTSKEKLYQELDLESLQLRRWYRKLGMFYRIY